MLKRFESKEGKRLLMEALKTQHVVAGDDAIASEIANVGTVRALKKGEVLIEEGAADNNLYFIVVGSLQTRVRGAHIATRQYGELVGEMAAIDPSSRRSATLIAAEDSVVVELSEPAFAKIAEAHPFLWKKLARQLASRLAQRNELVRSVNEQVRVFIISSTEALDIAREVQNGLAHEDVLAVVWTNGVFVASHYPIEDLERELAETDFAIIVAHDDDVVASRGATQVAPRDNVVFELGFFMGRLGRLRTILLEPKKARKEDQVKLPSDLVGLTTLRYRTGSADKLAALLGPTCTEIIKLIKKYGAREDQAQ